MRCSRSYRQNGKSFFSRPLSPLRSLRLGLPSLLLLRQPDRTREFETMGQVFVERDQTATGREQTPGPVAIFAVVAYDVREAHASVPPNPQQPDPLRLVKGTQLGVAVHTYERVLRVVPEVVDTGGPSRLAIDSKGPCPPQTGYIVTHIPNLVRGGGAPSGQSADCSRPVRNFLFKVSR